VTTVEGFFCCRFKQREIICSTGMTYSFKHLSMADTDADGIYRHCLFGDLGGNMWRFNLCTSSPGTSCTTADWTGEIYICLGEGPIYHVLTAQKILWEIWVYWELVITVHPISATGGIYMQSRIMIAHRLISSSLKKHFFQISATFIRQGYF